MSKDAEKTTKSDKVPDNPKTDKGKGDQWDNVEPPVETHSSGASTDALNSEEDRLEADPALEPELAMERQEEHLKETGAEVDGT